MNPFGQLFTVTCLSFLASETAAYVAGMHEYEGSCNADGYVLTSNYPVTRTIGQAALTSYVSSIEKLYLGRSLSIIWSSQTA